MITNFAAFVVDHFPSKANASAIGRTLIVVTIAFTSAAIVRVYFALAHGSLFRPVFSHRCWDWHRIILLDTRNGACW